MLLCDARCINRHPTRRDVTELINSHGNRLCMGWASMVCPKCCLGCQCTWSLFIYTPRLEKVAVFYLLFNAFTSSSTRREKNDAKKIGAKKIGKLNDTCSCVLHFECASVTVFWKAHGRRLSSCDKLSLKSATKMTLTAVNKNVESDNNFVKIKLV